MGKRVVVGGVAGGASAAAKAKRENPELEVVV
jgi:NADPH-dependent 2,4-dienoyl-CoA reductase/sulfur reductase-like enzyme